MSVYEEPHLHASFASFRRPGTRLCLHACQHCQAARQAWHIKTFSPTGMISLSCCPAWRAQVMRIQPDEAIYLKVNNKVPGLGLNLDVTKLDLTYKQRYNTHLPDAYERLILDVVNGDKRLFIRNDELDAAWALFTPILKVLPSFTPVTL